VYRHTMGVRTYAGHMDLGWCADISMWAGRCADMRMLNMPLDSISNSHKTYAYTYVCTPQTSSVFADGACQC